mgnify:CR=1 FL=1
MPIGTIVLSNFKFRVTTPPKRHRTEFYVLLLTSGTEVKCSKVARAINYEIVFDEEFSFLVHDNFRIKLQLHSIVMKDSSLFSSIATLFKIKVKKKSRCFGPPLIIFCFRIVKGGLFRSFSTKTSTLATSKRPK